MAAAIVGVILIALVSFGMGVDVGIRKARYSYQFGENYERNFMPPQAQGPGQFMHDAQGQDFRNAHGLAGSIISVSENNLVIKDKNNRENTVSVTDKTIIKNRNNDLKLSDLKQGDQIVIMGAPGDSGVVNADLIRVFNNSNNNND